MTDYFPKKCRSICPVCEWRWPWHNLSSTHPCCESDISPDSPKKYIFGIADLTWAKLGSSINWFDLSRPFWNEFQLFEKSWIITDCLIRCNLGFLEVSGCKRLTFPLSFAVSWYLRTFPTCIWLYMYNFLIMLMFKQYSHNTFCCPISIFSQITYIDPKCNVKFMTSDPSRWLYKCRKL